MSVEGKLTALETESLLLSDQRRLQGLASRIRARMQRRRPVSRDLAKAERLHEQAQRRIAARRARMPQAIHFDPQLPISAECGRIAELLSAHQVLIVCGETGSGKTTQLPKICLQQGRGLRGLIGHTQPRRIAARAVAARLNEELGQAQLAGHKIRFQDTTSGQNLIRVMTDGILLAEAAAESDLLGYDTLILDEAHERSLNIDFLLGYLKRLVRRRSELKLIITSATIDPESFSCHFDNAPIVRVGGRGFPVHTDYQPPPQTTPADIYNAIGEAVQSLWRRGPGAVLVFLPGTRQIREADRHLRRQLAQEVEILPLYSRLAGSRQNRVFQPRRDGYRVILATNVAETSLTVPGIRYVVDTGSARVNRFSPHSGVQRLLIEPVAQASADQRAGRCGRLGPGVCIRLFAEEDYANRPRFTTPEIQRANLAGVILQMHALGLGHIEDFPFMDPPDRRAVAAGYRLLGWLGAMAEGHLTRTGRQLAALPVDPRVGRIALASRGRTHQALVLLTAAALAVQDPRDGEPATNSQDAPKPLWQHSRSDFMGLLQTWVHYQRWGRESSRKVVRRRCSEAGLSYSRMREWGALYRQLCRSMDVAVAVEWGDDIEPAYADIHQCLLTGLLDHTGARETAYQYRGPRDRRFFLFPGSGLFRRPPPWVVSAELVRTSRLYARTNARIKPQWLEVAAAHLVTRQYLSPRWHRASAMVTESVCLFGLPLASRTVALANVDREQARWLFIRHALVLGEAHHRGAFFTHNQSLVSDIRRQEAKLRRVDLLADEDQQHALYERHIPGHICDMREFEAWRRRVERESPRHLFLRREELLREDEHAAVDEQFPDVVEVAGHTLTLTYALAPGNDRDGLSVHIPLDVLPALPAAPLEWLVPGLLEDKIAALIRTLPKRLRRHCVPVPEFARAAYQALAQRRGDLCALLAQRLQAMSGAPVASNDFDVTRLPAYLRAHFVVVDQSDAILAQGADLDALKQQLTQIMRGRFQQADRSGWERAGVRIGDLPEHLPSAVTLSGPEGTSRGYPALVTEDASVALRVFDNGVEAGRCHRRGVVWLLLREAPSEVRFIRKQVGQRQALLMRYRVLGGHSPIDDILEAAAVAVFLAGDVDIRDRSVLQTRLQDGRAALSEQAMHIADSTERLLQTAAKLRQRIAEAHLLRESREDIDAQLAGLIYPGFIRATPQAVWPRLGVYLQAMERRLVRAQRQPQRDRDQVAALRPLLDDPRTRPSAGDDNIDAADNWCWQLQELRVALFAQEFKSHGPASIGAFLRAMDANQ